MASAAAARRHHQVVVAAAASAAAVAEEAEEMVAPGGENQDSSHLNGHSGHRPHPREDDQTRGSLLQKGKIPRGTLGFITFGSSLLGSNNNSAATAITLKGPPLCRTRHS